MTISLPSYYIEKILENLNFNDGREVVLRYLDGCELSDVEYLDVLHIIWNQVRSKNEPQMLANVDEYERAIESKRPKKSGEPYSIEEDNVIRKRRGNGIFFTHIAVELGRSVSSVTKRWTQIK